MEEKLMLIIGDLITDTSRVVRFDDKGMAELLIPEYCERALQDILKLTKPNL